MTFTFNLASVTDIERFRMALSDTVEADAIFTDEMINFWISEDGSWQKAVIAGIQWVIRSLAIPTFQADWLKVDNAAALKYWKQMLDEKRGEYSISVLTATVTHVERNDTDVFDPTDERI